MQANSRLSPLPLFYHATWPAVCGIPHFRSGRQALGGSAKPPSCGVGLLASLGKSWHDGKAGWEASPLARHAPGGHIMKIVHTLVGFALETVVGTAKGTGRPARSLPRSRNGSAT